MSDVNQPEQDMIDRSLANKRLRVKEIRANLAAQRQLEAEDPDGAQLLKAYGVAGPSA